MIGCGDIWQFGPVLPGTPALSPEEYEQHILSSSVWSGRKSIFELTLPMRTISDPGWS